MSYAVKYQASGFTFTNQDTTQYDIEILKKDYAGAETFDLETTDLMFRLEYERVDFRTPLSNPLQKARLELEVIIQQESDFDVLEEIFQGDDNDHIMKLKRNGVTIWQGYVLNDLLEYEQKDYPYVGKIVAKDLTSLSQYQFPLEDNRQTLIVTIADLLDDLGYGLDIYTYTNWTNTDFASEGDFLAQTYIETKALRFFGKKDVDGIPQDDSTADNAYWLETILKNYGLQLRQVDGAWRIYHISALGTGTPYVHRYNSSGTLISSSTESIDVSIDNETKYVLPSSNNLTNPGIKESSVIFDHRTESGGINFDPQFTLTGNQSQSDTQFFLSDGTQTFKITADVFSSFGNVKDNDPTEVSRLQVKIEGTIDYYLQQDFTWGTDSVIVTQPMTITKPTLSETAGVFSADARGSINILTSELPADADGVLTVSFFNALNDQDFATSTIYSTPTFIINNSTANQNTDALSYRLVQSANVSTVYNHGVVLFGDGPTDYSVSAQRYGTGDTELTSDGWKRRGESGAGDNFFKLLLREVMEVQARGVRSLSADVYGEFSPHNVLSYDGDRFFFLGGVLNGKNLWTAEFLKIESVTLSLTFEEAVSKAGLTSLGGTSQQDVQFFWEAVKASQYFNSIFLANYVGEITEQIDEGSTITSIKANLSAQLRDGEDFVIVDKEREKPYYINIIGDYNTGENVTITIEEQYFRTTIPVGSPVILSGGLVESYFNVDPNKLLISVQTRDESFYYGKVNEDFSGGATKTSLSLVNSDISATNQAVFNDGQVLRLRREDGESQLVTVDGDQSFSSSPYTLQLNSFTTDFLAFGVSTPQFAKYKAYIEPVNQGSSIEFLKGQLILSADGSGGLAQIRLDGTGASSSITLDADNINVVGQTTFTSGLVSEGLETQSGAQSKANTAQSNAEATASTLATQAKNDARNNVATNLGYTDYNDMVSEAQAGRTVISGGLIRTSLIDTQSLFAQSVVIDTGGSIQSSIYSAGSSGFKINADGSAEFNNVTVRSSNFSSLNSGFELDGSGIQFNESITIGSTGGIGTFTMANPTIASESTTAGGSGSSTAYYHRPLAGTATTFVRSNQYFFSHDDHETLDGSGNEVGSRLFFGFYTGGASPTSYIGAGGDGTFTFNVTGNITYTGSISQTSDAELKENVVPLGQTLEKITQLEAKVYDMVDDDEREIGLFAQDVEPLFPEAVNTVTRPNEEGEEITYKTLSYIQLIPALIESIKELKQEIDQLKNG